MVPTLDVEVVAVDVVVVVAVEALNGERKMWINQLMNLTRNWIAIMLKQCKHDVAIFNNVKLFTS